MAVAIETPTRIGVGEVRISVQAQRNVNDALTRDRLTYGKWTRQFEAEFARRARHRWACFMNSGTSALQVGLAALNERYGWNDGARVVVPALTFVASLNVIIQNRLEPVLCDVDPDHYDIDLAGAWSTFEMDYERDPVAVMPVSLFGQPYDERAVKVFVESDHRRSWKVIEDSCETMFVGGRRDADVVAYSTYACHLVNTGVGGFAATDDPDLAALIRSLANHGRSGIYTGIDDALGQWETMSARFLFERLGYSYRATELEAAIGCAELELWDEQLVARRRNAQFLREALADLPLQLPRERVAGAHAYMMFPIVCDDGVDRDALVVHLEARGIETRPMLPLTSQPYVRRIFGADVEDRFPVARRINRQGFYVGCHPHLSIEDLARMDLAFHDFFDR